jgi:hypothetical protein
MKKLFASLTLVAFLTALGLVYAQAGGGSTDRKAPKEGTTKAITVKQTTRKTKKGHKGGKKGKKGAVQTTTPPPK